MKKAEIITKAGNMLGRAGLRLKKHSPEILVVAGVVGAVASAVLACRATTKLSGILEETRDDLDAVAKAKEDEELKGQYSEEDAQRDTVIIYVHAGWKLVKLYAPSAALGALSVTGILVGHNLLRRRNLALSATCAAITREYKEYRSRVVDRFGEVVDRELKYNVKAKQVLETVKDENGEEKAVERTVYEPAGPLGCSEYARFFNRKCPDWEDNPDYNQMFLRAQQNWANDKLRAQGHLYLNEVYDALGLERSKAGQIVGWVYNPEHPVGDNYVDFGFCEMDFERGREILLDFNVDGPILDLM